MKSRFLLTIFLFAVFGNPLMAETLAAKIGYPQQTWDKLMSEYEGKRLLDYHRDFVQWKGSHFDIGKKEAAYLFKHRNPLYEDFIYAITDGKKSRKSNEAILRLGYQDHDNTQANAPEGWNLQFILKHEWLGL